LNFLHWSPAPEGLEPVQRRNFINVQIDGVAVGLWGAVSPFLPVFLARLGASNFQVGMLTSMPAMTGLFLALVIGRMIQSSRRVVPWYSFGRVLVVACYGITGILPFFVPADYIVVAILIVWAFATVPQIIVNVAFSVVMSGVAGPKLRYDLMSRRWSVLGLTNSIAVAIVGQVLDRLAFPINYQLVFVVMSFAGLISFYYSSHIQLPEIEPPPTTQGQSLSNRLQDFISLVRGQPKFTSFMFKRFIFFTGTTLAAPLFPLYYVREVQASDAWIGIINTVQSAILLIGYAFWTRQSRARGSRFVLLWTTLGLTAFPILVAFTRDVQWIVVYAAIAGVFQAGLDLVFFDELMKTIPVEYAAMFVAIAQSLQYFSTVASPLVGTALADYIGLGGALIVSGGIRLVAFGLFLWKK
jgi:MFS family permease